MSIVPFQRLVSHASLVYTGTSREQVALNAANVTGPLAESLSRRTETPTWPAIKKFENDTVSQVNSPFGSSNNPDYVWDPTTFDGQQVSLGIASRAFTVSPGFPSSFNMSLFAFIDNAMAARLELYELQNGSYIKTPIQPAGFGDIRWVAGEPDNPAVGLTVTGPPYTFEDIRYYSTRIDVLANSVPITYKIVLTFEATNYLIRPEFSSTPSNANNPAALQFVMDIYAQNVQFLYVSNFSDSLLEIYNISSPTVPFRIGETGAGSLTGPVGIAITGTTLYVANGLSNSIEIYSITTPTLPVRVGEFNGGNLNGPIGLAISGTTLYIANSADDNIEIYDISSPFAPIRVGQFSGGSLSNPGGLAITGNFLYIANRDKNSIDIFNIAVPTSPIFVANFNGGNLSSPVGLAIDGTYLFVANLGNDTIEVYDITNPISPVRLSDFTSGNLDGPVDLAVTNQTLYVTSFFNDLIDIYNISNPTVPTLVGQINDGALNGPAGLAVYTLLG